MNRLEQRIQRDGYVAAFRHDDVVRAILSGPAGRIAVTYVEFAGAADQAVVAPWTILSSREDAAMFADGLAAAPLAARGASTSISAGLTFAARQFANSGASSPQKTIDISGDGISDAGPPLSTVRDTIVRQGVTINGLSIAAGNADDSGPYGYLFSTEPDHDMGAYYEQNVIGGPGAFVIAISDAADFAPAIRRKLILEIAWQTRDADDTTLYPAPAGQAFARAAGTATRPDIRRAGAPMPSGMTTDPRSAPSAPDRASGRSG